MKKRSIVLAIIAMTVLIVFGITACGGGGAGGSGGGGGGGGTKGTPFSATYKGEDLAKNKYTLKISGAARSVLKNDKFELIIEDEDGDVISETDGTVTGILGDKYNLSGGLDVVLSGDNISSIIGEVKLSNGGTFVIRTFATIYLGANRWEQCWECNAPTCDIEGHEIFLQVGEHYNSGNAVKLADIYSGSLDEFLQAGTTPEGTVKLKVTGTVNKKLENFGVTILCAWSYWPEPWEGRAIAYTTNVKQIGHGPFEVILEMDRWYKDLISDLPNGGGEVYVEFGEDMFGSFPNNLDDPNFPTYGTKIPENVPNGALYATLTNIIIEPVTE